MAYKIVSFRYAVQPTDYIIRTENFCMSMKVYYRFQKRIAALANPDKTPSHQQEKTYGELVRQLKRFNSFKRVNENPDGELAPAISEENLALETRTDLFVNERETVVKRQIHIKDEGDIKESGYKILRHEMYTDNGTGFRIGDPAKNVHMALFRGGLITTFYDRDLNEVSYADGMKHTIHKYRI